jgi:hypothetical protein
VTRDLDLPGFGNASASVMEDLFRNVLSSKVEPLRVTRQKPWQPAPENSEAP